MHVSIANTSSMNTVLSYCSCLVIILKELNLDSQYFQHRHKC